MPESVAVSLSFSPLVIVHSDTQPNCFHQLIEAIAEVHPTAVAIDGWFGSTSYRELNARANALAVRLTERGVRCDDRVGLYAPVTPSLLIAALAVLKAGAGFVPLDPSEPVVRTRLICEDAKPSLVLVEPSLVAAFPATAPVLALDTADARATNPELPAHPRQLAYVIFTSGSTGRPKGAMIDHSNLMNYVAWARGAHRLGSRELVFPAVTRFTSDASMQQLLAPLGRGSSVWLLEPGTGREPDALLAALRTRPGAALHCVPSLWEELLLRMEGDPSEQRGIRLSALFLGGELVREDLWARTRTLCPDTELANVYGPSETTVQVTGGFQRTTAPLSVGWPVDGAVLEVLDASLEPVAPGEVGEVYVGGAPVGRGYINRPELTAERFIPNPRSTGRLYRTGDLGRWHENEALCILGRVDEQVKVRGFRVELSEVEQALCSHPSIRQAVASVLSPETSQARIGALMVLHDAAALDADELNAFLAERLPSYMLPSLWRTEASLPRTANGKLDRRAAAEALVASSEAPADDDAAHRLRSPIEDVLASIWRTLLGADSIGPEDDFFRLGGHSLQATQVAARVREALGVKLPVRIVFELTTLRTLARHIEEQLRGEAVATISEVGATRGPLSLQQTELLATHRLTAGTPLANVILPIEVQGVANLQILRSALGGLSARHALLRTRFIETDAGWVQQVEQGATVSLEHHDLKSLPAAERSAAARRVGRRLHGMPFELSAPSWPRAALVELETDRSILFVCLPHLVCDGQSLRIIVDDVAAAYAAALQQQASPPEQLPRYVDFALWQRQKFDAGDWQRSIAFWLDELREDAAPLTFIQAKDNRERRFRFRLRTRCIEGHALQALMLRIRELATTPFMALCAAVATAIEPFTSGDVRIGTLSANREPEFEQVVGPFANTLALRLPRVEGDFQKAMRASWSAFLRTLPHHGVPFELIAAALRERGVGSQNLYHVGVTMDIAHRVASKDSTVFRQMAATPEALEQFVVPSSCPLGINASMSAGTLMLLAEYDDELVPLECVDEVLARIVGALCEFAGCAARAPQ